VIDLGVRHQSPSHDDAIDKAELEYDRFATDLLPSRLRWRSTSRTPSAT